MTTWTPEYDEDELRAELATAIDAYRAAGGTDDVAREHPAWLSGWLAAVAYYRDHG